MKYEEALSFALSGDAVFLIGSGFSVGATNILGLPFFVGSELAKDLCQKVDLDSDTPLDIVSQEYIDSIGERSLTTYLKERFCVEEYKSYYKAFSRIKELKVYTTNYDNLIEKICNDSGKKIKRYNLSARVRTANKNNMVMHLNGSIDDLGETLDENFLLTHLSYSRHALYDSPWFPYLHDEIKSASAVFVLGLSFKSDLDLRRLISAESNTPQKCFIIE